MKRSQVLKKIEELYNLELSSFPKENPADIFAENLLCHLENMGMMIVSEPERSEVLGWEPEEGWDAFIIEQDKRDQERDFVIPDHDNSRGASIARKFLSGSSFEALAEELNVTRERIRQIICKNRRLYK